MDQFDQFRAASLYCPKCRTATPARERLLLVLPDGELMEYLCARCGTSVGKKKTRAGLGAGLLPRPGGRPDYL
ncbi:MAG: cytoplasmic protein [Candidatus Omnitrophota bacterium]